MDPARAATVPATVSSKVNLFDATSRHICLSSFVTLVAEMIALAQRRHVDPDALDNAYLCYVRREDAPHLMNAVWLRDIRLPELAAQLKEWRAADRLQGRPGTLRQIIEGLLGQLQKKLDQMVTASTPAEGA